MVEKRQENYAIETRGPLRGKCNFDEHHCDPNAWLHNLVCLVLLAGGMQAWHLCIWARYHRALIQIYPVMQQMPVRKC